MNMLAIILLQVGYNTPGFEYYRAFPQDAIQNQNYSRTKLTMPVMAVGAGYIPALGGNITMQTIVYGMKILAQNVQGVLAQNVSSTT
jgi:hypothetical protein